MICQDIISHFKTPTFKWPNDWTSPDQLPPHQSPVSQIPSKHFEDHPMLHLQWGKQTKIECRFHRWNMVKSHGVLSPVKRLVIICTVICKIKPAPKIKCISIGVFRISVLGGYLMKYSTLSIWGLLEWTIKQHIYIYKYMYVSICISFAHHQYYL